MDAYKDFIARMGTFFLLIGVFVMMLFVATDRGGQANFLFFFISVILLVFGWYFKRISAPPPKQGDGGRFAGIRKWQQKQREAKAKREAKKKEQEEKKKQKQQPNKK